MGQERAIVIGAGWAGEGHTVALRACGVDIVAICGRDKNRTATVAAKLGVPGVSTDWRQTMQAVRPTIVALATPATLRREVVEEAVRTGAHILADKPLASTASEAESLYRLVAAAGIKHAYAATLRYDPSVSWLTELVQTGVIGDLRNMFYELRMDHPPFEAFGWWSMVATGGGPINNFFTHMLPIFESVAGGEVVRAVGTSSQTHHRVPVMPSWVDERMRVRPETYPPLEELATLEWRDFDAETDVTALLAIQNENGIVPLSAHIVERSAVEWPPNGIRLYGSKGALLADGFASWTISLLRGRQGVPEELPVPERLQRELPQVGDEPENKWAALARQFVADIRGEPFEPYLTFRDGWRYQCIGDAIRSGVGWNVMPV
jgi:predicted dehydrogenase